MTWALALASSAIWIKVTHVGPVVLVVSDRFDLGVHTGDAWSLVPVAAAAVITARARARR